MKAPQDCGILILHDGDGYTCARLGSDVCSDCGTSLCDAHAEACTDCEEVYCDCCLHFHRKAAHVKKPLLQRVMVPERKSA